MKVIVIPQDTEAGVYLAEIGDTLPAMQSLVGGFLEVVRCAELGDMWINEEGKLHGLRRNLFATHLAHECMAIDPRDFIAGNAFLAGHDGQGETVDVPDLTVEVFDRVYGIDLSDEVVK